MYGILNMEVANKILSELQTFNYAELNKNYYNIIQNKSTISSIN